MSADFSSHVTRLAEVLERLRQAGLKLKPSKCSLFQTQVKYLGHIVSDTGVATDPEKIQAISEWAAPQDVTQLRSFLGTTGYYHRYVPDYASIAKPLTLLTSEGVSWKWEEDEQEAFLNSLGTNHVKARQTGNVSEAESRESPLEISLR
ncbi:uncharacterized protein [Watersipora subatra]|uniref:uncharacterized protein n=1 Tax=Watersipora subatra TaxID=2589382 RepID=UPI00355C11A8